MANSDKKARREAKIDAKIKKYQKTSALREYKKEKAIAFSNGVGLVLGVLLIAILMINIIKFSNGGKTITFSGLLNYLSNIDVNFNVPNLDSLTAKFTIANEWSILDGLRIFLNSLGTILGVVAYLGANLVYCITFLSKLLIYILG